MNYKKLGNTELNVSTICLGTMTWGEQNSQEDAFQQMNYALENGVNFWILPVSFTHMTLPTKRIV